MTAADAEAAADIICSLRAADLAGWTPPWCRPPPACDGVKEEELAWPAVARGKRSRSRRRSTSGSGSAATKGRWARGSPASPLDYSGCSGASTSGGEDGGFCSPPAIGHRHAGPTPAPAAATKVDTPGRRPSILPVPPPRPAGQRPRKKMRLPEIQQLVQSLTVENDGLREEMKALERACTALSKENGKLEDGACTWQLFCFWRCLNTWARISKWKLLLAYRIIYLCLTVTTPLAFFCGVAWGGRAACADGCSSESVQLFMHVSSLLAVHCLESFPIKNTKLPTHLYPMHTNPNTGQSRRLL